MVQLLDALSYCHSRRITHRDIKLENILLTKSMEVKLTDFGLSNLMQDGEFLQTHCGSLDYAAPEIITAQAYEGTSVDVWSTGVVLYTLVASTLPFESPSIPLLYEKIRLADFELPFFFSEDLKDLLRRMLDPNPVTRITIPQVLAHPWCRGKVCLKIPQKINEKAFYECLGLSEFSKLAEKEEILRDAIVKNKKTQFVMTYRILTDAKANKKKKAALQEDEPYSCDLSLLKKKDLGRHRAREEGTWKFGLSEGFNLGLSIENILMFLSNIGFFWKIVDSFTLKFKKDTSKFCISVYSDHGKFVLDFQVVSGPIFHILDIIPTIKTLLIE